MEQNLGVAPNWSIRRRNGQFGKIGHFVRRRPPNWSIPGNGHFGVTDSLVPQSRAEEDR
jgi:hypothetical protein